MKDSKKHHYIPKFYLNGFVNSEEEFYVYDKVEDIIRKSKPINSFFENYRNTGKIIDEKSTMLEYIYQNFDGQVSLAFDNIRKKKDNFFEDSSVLPNLLFFIAIMYWRIPESDVALEELIDKLDFRDTGFDIVDKNGNSVATKELQQDLKSVDMFRKMYRIFLPFLIMRNKKIKIDFDNWTVYTRGNNLQVTGDNPLIINNFKDFSSLNENLIFPLSSNKVLIHTLESQPKTITHDFSVKLDVTLIQQSKRFTCCSNELYLKYIVKCLYSYSKNYNFIDKMKEDLFNYFK